jgi:hypothetical protein
MLTRWQSSPQGLAVRPVIRIEIGITRTATDGRTTPTRGRTVLLNCFRAMMRMCQLGKLDL